MSTIEDEFREAGVMRGGVLLLRPNDAIRMVQRPREQRILVLGLDGFVVTDSTTQPILEESIDLSNLINRPNTTCWEIAEQFLNDRKSSNLFFEVVIDE
jgi:hypothetical protein